MTAEQFYEEYKAALNYLGVRWGDKDSVPVWLEGQYFVMAANGKKAHVLLPSST